MLSSVPEIKRIDKKMREDPISGNHSGSSYGCMMRNMHFIAKNGYEAFKNEYIKQNTPKRIQRTVEPTQEETTQAQEILYPPEPPQ
jgi:hypothetical protein